MSRINILPYAYIEEGFVRMFRTCPKKIQTMPAQLFGSYATLNCHVFTNRKGIRMIECYFKIDSSWSFYQTIEIVKMINQDLTLYLKLK